MRDFNFYLPTRVLFGRDGIKRLGELIWTYGGSKVLLVTGKGSVKKSGVYDRVVSELNGSNLDFIELHGIDPNPRLSSVIEGARLCRQHGIDFILAVGGGSVIDCSKGIAAAARYDGDPWDFWTWKTNVANALPIGTVLTLSATGSEMNDGTVISNEALKEKRGMGSNLLFPKFSIMDPEYTYSVPRNQTAAGIADIMSHVFEFYFSHTSESYLQNRLAEAILKTCIKYGPIACEHPENYEARSNIMWASSMALNGVICEGLVFDGFNHIVEHAISGIYDLTHGIGLAILTVHWMDYILGPDTAYKLAEYARNVWGVDETDDYNAARLGIAKTKAFYMELGLPMKFTEVGIDDVNCAEIISKSFWGDTLGNFKALTKMDVERILQAALKE